MKYLVVPTKKVQTHAERLQNSSPRHRISNSAAVVQLADSTMVPSPSTVIEATTSLSTAQVASTQRRRSTHSESQEMDSLGVEHPRKQRVVASSTSLSDNAVAIISTATLTISSYMIIGLTSLYLNTSTGSMSSPIPILRLIL